MEDTVICAHRIGKVYDPIEHRGLFDLRERLSTFAQMGFRGKSPDSERYSSHPRKWALRGVSLEIQRGEVIGVMGRNGSGKTTLLKLLAQITEPTEGEAIIHGRVGTLLDVGAGLHGELSGRENVFLNGAIHGMHAGEIRARFDEIVAFAEMEQAIDQPLKYFSTGMCLRLAFSIASFLCCDVLLVDEVLAQADPRFQSKCMDRMLALAGQGQVVVMVSHEFESVHGFCTRGLVFAGGHLIHDGAVDEMRQFIRPMDTLNFASTMTAHEFSERRTWEAK